MEFQELPIFGKECKRLGKKYRSLAKDIAKLKPVLGNCPRGNGSKHWNRLCVLDDGKVVVFKVRLACAALRGESLLRIVYAHHAEKETIEFLEIYFKGNKENEDSTRIQEYLLYIKKRV